MNIVGLGQANQRREPGNRIRSLPRRIECGDGLAFDARCASEPYRDDIGDVATQHRPVVRGKRGGARRSDEIGNLVE